MNQTRIIQHQIKQKVQKDTLQNLIYELKAREERFEQISQIANQKGLGYPSVQARGHSLGIKTDKRDLVDTSKDKFNIPSSPKNDFQDQLLLLTDMSPEMKLSIAKQNDSMNKKPQR